MTNINFEKNDALDFLKKIKSKSVDLVLIDPPYFISKESGFLSCVEGVDRFKILTEFGDWDKKENFDKEKFSNIISNLYRVLKVHGTIICFYDIWKIESLKEILEESKFKQIRFIEWIKSNPVPINSKINYLSNCREVALTAVKKSKPTFNSSYDNGVYEYPICQDKGRFHPTQKPIALKAELIKKHSKEGELVLDCFAGSATTAIACLETDRMFTGCEIEETYYNLAKDRIENYK